VALSKIEHLSKEEIIRNGSIFTPKYIVDIARNWLSDKISQENYVIDFGVGYGAFISEFLDFTNNLIATDIDINSVEIVNKLFPKVNVILENSLVNISRSKYGLKNHDKIIIIGNPPYNDVTSQYKKGQKGSIEFDHYIRSRDLGISFLKMYSILQPEYICVLHPLSYLIKKTNFNSLSFFNDYYKLEKGLIFSSYEFESIKKSNTEFPVVLGLYKKSNLKMHFTDIEKFEFDILNSKDKFCLINYKTIDGLISKYPKKDSILDKDLKFYTIRDINALKRNKTFISAATSNCLKVSLDELYKYAWLDYFKNNFMPDSGFLYGNLSPLYSKEIEENETKIELVSYVIKNNEVVKKHFLKYDLFDELKRIYLIEEYLSDYPILSNIIRKLNKKNID